MTIYYIAPSPTGNDTTGNGSSATPWATISKAHTSATAGDTIICKDGTYTWVSQTFTKILTIRAQNARLAIFDGAAAGVQWDLVAGQTITDIHFTNAVRTGESQPIFEATGVGTYTFNGCIFDNIIINVTNVDQGWGGLVGNYGGTVTFAVLMEGCLIDDIVNDGDVYAIFAGRVLGSTGAIITFMLRNTIINIVNSGADRIQYLFVLYAGGTSPTYNIAMTNAIIYNNSGAAVTYAVGGSYNVDALSHSCFYNITSVPAGTNLITSDPLFVDAAGGVFDLRPTSPCLGTGTLV